MEYLTALFCHIASQVVVGSGEFGVVYPGIWKLQPVAIKVSKGAVHVDGFRALLAEAKIMAYLGDHEHIVKFVGADVTRIAERKEEFGFEQQY